MKSSLAFLAAVLSLASPVQAVEQQIVAGAGPSTKIVQTFFKAFASKPAAEGYRFSVMETSVKHAGGIKNAELYLFGRTGRPLSAKEKGMSKEEIFLGRVPIAFAVGLETGVDTLTLKQLEQIFKRKIENWDRVGGSAAAILLVGREPTEALFSVLKEEFPYFQTVTFDRIFKRDHEVVDFLKSPGGRYAIGFGARPNFPKTNLVDVPGLDAGVKMGLVYDLTNRDHEVIRAAQDFAASAEWKEIVREQTDFLPIR